MSKKIQIVARLLGLIAIAAAGILIAGRQSPATALSIEPVGVMDRIDPSGVRYWAATGPGGRDVSLGVRYDYESKEGVEAYITWNRREADRLLQTDVARFWVVVNFNGPQPRVAFEQFVKDYNMEVVEYTMRAVEAPTELMPEGNRVTAMGAPENGILIPDDLFNMMYSSVAGDHAATFRGWITVRGAVDREGFIRLRSDSRVAVVEVIETIGREALKDNRARLVGAQSQLLEALDTDRPYSGFQLDGTGTLYWKLEDFGLVPKD